MMQCQSFTGILKKSGSRAPNRIRAYILLKNFHHTLGCPFLAGSQELLAEQLTNLQHHSNGVGAEKEEK